VINLERGLASMRGLARVREQTGKRVHYVHARVLQRLHGYLDTLAQTGEGKLHSSHANWAHELVLDDEHEYAK
jgi:hypothetical protein